TTLAASSTTTAPTPATSVPVPASSTTTAPAPTTTTPRKPAPSTTTTTFPANAIRLTIVNQHPNRVEVNINGASYNLAPGQRLGPVPFVPDPEGHESYSAVVAGTSCGLGDSGIPALEKPPGTSVTMRLTPQGACDPAGPGVPNLDVAFEV